MCCLDSRVLWVPSLTSCFFSPFEFFTFSHTCEIPTTLMLRSPLYPSWFSSGQTQLQVRLRWCLWACSPAQGFLSHSLHSGAPRSVFYHFATQSLVSGPKASASVGSLLEMQNFRPHLKPTASEPAFYKVQTICVFEFEKHCSESSFFHGLCSN